MVEGGDLVVALWAQLDRLVAQLDRKPAIRAMVEGRADRDLYVSSLVQSRHYVALTYPCLLAAGRRMKELGQHDALADLFFQKAEEERDHDLLIDEDLRALGLDLEQTLAAEQPGGWVSAYNSWIRAATSGQHSAAFLGSVYVLEGLATLRAGVVAGALVSRRGVFRGSPTRSPSWNCMPRRISVMSRTWTGCSRASTIRSSRTPSL